MMFLLKRGAKTSFSWPNWWRDCRTMESITYRPGTLYSGLHYKHKSARSNEQWKRVQRVQAPNTHILYNFFFFFIIYKDKPLQALGLEALFVNQKLYSVRSGNLSLKQQCLCSQCCKQATGCAKGIFTQGWHIHRFMNISLNAIKVLGALLLAS